MIIDYQLKFSEDQAVTEAAASTNIVDLGAAGNVIGHEPYLVVLTKVAATSLGAATVNFKLETSVDAAFTSPITLVESGAVAKAALTVGSEPLKVKLPLGCKQYLRVYYGVATADLTAGKFDAFLTADVKAS